MEGTLILKTDTYKNGHWRQYPPGTEKVYSYFTSRGGKWPQVVFFGLSYYLQEYLSKPVTAADIDYAAERVAKLHGSSDVFHRVGWEHIVREHGGYLPVEIKALPEGSVAPSQTALMTVESTDPAVPFVTNYIETLLSMLWYPCTVATQSMEMRRDRLRFTRLTGGNPEGIDFLLHDFGYRGSTSDESAAIGGAAHLAAGWQGSDNWAAVEFLSKYYGVEDTAAFSINAYEHSTVTAYGRENEVEAYRRALELHPTGLLAVVSDSYDYHHAVEEIWGGELREQVLLRDGKLVIRPDSGDPRVIDPWTLRTLGMKFGFEVNEAGYRVLGPDPKVGMIQGDGIDYESHREILQAVADSGHCTDDLPFGSGGGLLQKGLDRDTLRFAFKAAEVVVDGEPRAVYKSPGTDPQKASRAGRMKTVASGSSFETVGMDDDRPDAMVTVYRNGEIEAQLPTLADVRSRVAQHLGAGR